MSPSTSARDFLGVGWAFPPARDPVTGRVALVHHGRDVAEAIRIVLGTCPGERVMRPEFGCGAHRLVFGSLDATTVGRVVDTVREALARYEPRIEVLDVRGRVPEGPTGRLEVSIDYVLRTTNRRDNLVYSFYLRGKS